VKKPVIIARTVVAMMMVGGSVAAATGSALAAPLPRSAAPQVKNGIVQVSSTTQLEYIDSHQNQPIVSGATTTYLGATIELTTNINLSG
jgi:hypothetical protein